MPSNDHLVLIPQSFPFPTAAENTFIVPELPTLAAKFASCTICPTQISGDPAALPSNIILELGLGRHLASARSGLTGAVRAISTVLGSKLFYNELRIERRFLWNPKSWHRIISYVVGAEYIADWIERQIIAGRFSVTHTVFYAYWNHIVVTALAIVKEKHPDLFCVSRTHGADLYIERYTPAFLPARQKNIDTLNGLFFASNHGKEYFLKNYPDQGKKLHVSPLGSFDPHFLSQQSTDGILRLISCSAVIPVKRIDLLVAGIAEAARQQPAIVIHWLHIGGGSLQREIDALANQIFPPSVTWKITGQVSPATVHQFYRQQPVDLFLNMSSSEGGRPVAIIEALSYGVPVVGPANGGVQEIITPETGWLLSPNPSPDEIAQAICHYAGSKALQDHYHHQARQHWLQHYEASHAASRFVDSLLQLKLQSS